MTWCDLRARPCAWARLADMPRTARTRRAFARSRSAIPADHVGPSGGAESRPAADHRTRRLRGSGGGFRAKARASARLRRSRAPDWFELRAETDDVAFPVIKDVPAEPNPSARRLERPRTPAPAADGNGLRMQEDDDDQEEEDDDFDGDGEVVERTQCG